MPAKKALPAPKRPVPKKRAPKAPPPKPENRRQLPAIIEQGFDAMMGAATPSAQLTGDGVVIEKRELVGVPFVVIGWAWHPSDMENSPEFVSVEAVTESGEVIVFNDGSTGIARQCRAIEDKAPEGLELQYDPNGLARVRFLMGCKRGLRASEYMGPKGPATTFYFG